MKNIYIKLVIAGRDIATIPARDIADVAAGVIVKGAEDGREYITIDDVPDRHRAAVVAALSAEGYDEHGEPTE
ncbi:MAG: hypothetical protein NC548_22155 [Lachnospiraceae bacterium]|nr:hypothetical protein [Lachnospiraceae bacterium]